MLPLSPMIFSPSQSPVWGSVGEETWPWHRASSFVCKVGAVRIGKDPRRVKHLEPDPGAPRLLLLTVVVRVGRGGAGSPCHLITVCPGQGTWVLSVYLGTAPETRSLSSIQLDCFSCFPEAGVI